MPRKPDLPRALANVEVDAALLAPRLQKLADELAAHPDTPPPPENVLSTLEAYHADTIMKCISATRMGKPSGLYFERASRVLKRSQRAYLQIRAMRDGLPPARAIGETTSILVAFINRALDDTRAMAVAPADVDVPAEEVPALPAGEAVSAERATALLDHVPAIDELEETG